ncbi:keratin-associated protein 24-1 [Saccopteryx leptura]|uniref:keratin-associated protein 24-1 n=1 Tax=Saccopteryx leptura TaxID=249018 RepID=UPI00339C0FE2
MWLLGSPGDAGRVTTAATFGPGDISPAFGLCLPSSYQGTLWLLEDGQSLCSDTLSGQPWTSCLPRTSCQPCGSPITGKVDTVMEHSNARPHPRSCTQTEGHPPCSHTPHRGALASCQTLSCASQSLGPPHRLSKTSRPLSHHELGDLGYRRYPNLSFLPGGFSPSYYVASSGPSQNYLVRNHRYPGYRPASCQPLGYVSRNLQSLSSVPCTFPPLRYLCSRGRPLSG